MRLPESLAAAVLLAAFGIVANAGESALRFTDVTESSGLVLRTTSGGTPSREILEVNGGGVALFDYDNDGDLDVFVANGATLDRPEEGPGSRLFANDGHGKFTDATERTGLDLTRWAMGVAVGDYDGDGDADLYVTCYGPNVLLRNDEHEGGRRFVEIGADAGVDHDGWGASAAFADLDGDGDLDLYVVNYLVFDVDKPPARSMFKGAPIFGGPAGLEATGDVYYENRGDGTFRDATARAGFAREKPGYGMGVSILDLDGDGRQDVYVGNDSTPNFLFRNLGGGKFEEIGVASGIASNYDGRNQATMGIAIGDVDGNRLPDVFTTNFSSDTNTLHLNLGRALFDDRTSQYGLAAISRPFLSWGTGFYDFDSDGDEELFVANGHIYPEADTHEIDSGYQQPPLLFERVGNRFERNLTAGPMLTRKYSARATAFGDLDDDGDVDIVMTTLNDLVRLFRNDATPRSVVVVELRGRAGNLHGLGSLVELLAGGKAQRRWIHGGSYESVDAPLAYFALPPGAGDKPRLRVSWANGKTVDYAEIAVNRRTILTEGDAVPRSIPLRGRSE